jgi:hypothetical protein
MIRAGKDMIYIRGWNDLKKYGIDLLTGEACAIVYRGLFDLTQPGLDLVTRTIGACEIKAPSNMNGDGAIASMLLPYSMFEALAVMALFEVEHCAQVVIAEPEGGGQLMIGAGLGMFEAEMERLGCKTLPEYLAFSFLKVKRHLKYPQQREGITVGMSNVHQMSGRIS